MSHSQQSSTQAYRNWPIAILTLLLSPPEYGPMNSTSSSNPAPAEDLVDQVPLALFLMDNFAQHAQYTIPENPPAGFNPFTYEPTPFLADSYFGKDATKRADVAQGIAWLRENNPGPDVSKGLAQWVKTKWNNKSNGLEAFKSTWMGWFPGKNGLLARINSAVDRSLAEQNLTTSQIIQESPKGSTLDGLSEFTKMRQKYASIQAIFGNSIMETFYPDPAIHSWAEQACVGFFVLLTNRWTLTLKRTKRSWSEWKEKASERENG